MDPGRYGGGGGPYLFSCYETFQKEKCDDFFFGGGPYSTIEYGPGSIEKLLYEV